MSKQSERLSDSIGEINDAYVTGAHAASHRSSGVLRRVILIAACVALLAGCIIAGVLIVNKSQEGTPSDSGEAETTADTKNGGDILHINTDSVEYASPVNLYWKSYSATAGSRFEGVFPNTQLSDTAVRLVSSSANTDTVIGVTAEYAEAGTVTDELKMMMAGFLGQYLSSILSFDYEAHFAMFPQEMVQARFARQVEERGLTYEQAISDIRENARRLVPFDSIYVSFTVSDCHEMTEAEVTGYLEGHTWMWEDAGIHTADVDGWIFCRFQASGLIGGRYQCASTDEDADPMVLFRLRGAWYLTPLYLDDDISVDLALASKDSGSGYFREDSQSGFVTWREGNLFCLDNSTLVFFPDLPDEVAVGDYAEATGYRGLGLRAEDTTAEEENRHWLTVFRAGTVSVSTPEQNTTNADE